MQTNKKLLFKDDARQQILKGVEIIANAVRCTLGPKGRNVVIERPSQAPHVTKDGVTVAKSINLKHQFENLGAQMIKEVASQTVDVAGDGPQPLYSKVLTPTGWVAMGSLKVGDDICGTNNTVQKIIGVYPKGIKQVYKVTTSDGRFVECCEDHLWKVITSYGKEKILTTKQILDSKVVKIDSKNQKRYKYYIPTTCVEFENSDVLSLDPYLVGALLGDGYLSDNRTNIELSLGLHEGFILDEMKLPAGCSYTKRIIENKNYIKARITGIDEKGRSIIKGLLQELGLIGKRSHTKFIPKSYLFSTVENRERLLKGMIDTDGHINKRGLFEYGTVSKQLYMDFVELCRSLGKQIHTYQIKRKEGDGSYGKNTIYRITELKGYKHGLKISKIEKTNNRVEMQCLKVSNDDHLYVTDDYVVTHNTTTATVLACDLYREGLKKVLDDKFSPVEIKKGIDFAVETVCASLDEMSKPIETREDIVHIGTVSSNGDKRVGEMLADAMDKMGRDGIITVEEAKGYDTTLEIVEGMRINRGYVSPYFVNNTEKMQCVLEDPYVLISDNKFDQMSELTQLLEQIVGQSKPILVIADEIGGEAMHGLTVNHQKGILTTCAIRAPEFGASRHGALEDIAILTNGQIVSKAGGIKIEDINVEEHVREKQFILGTCKKAIVSKGNCTLVGYNNRQEEIDKRIGELENQLKDPTISDNQASVLRRRLARLSGGIGIIRVGGSTEVEMREYKDRIDDALCATQAAVESGLVPGGGIALVKAIASLSNDPKESKDFNSGVDIVREACLAPISQIIQNAGGETQNILSRITSSNDSDEGWNAATGKFCNMIAKGIIDPLKVPKTALRNAASVAGLMLTVDCAIVEEDLDLLGAMQRQIPAEE